MWRFFLESRGFILLLLLLPTAQEFKETLNPDLTGTNLLSFLEHEQAERMGMKDRLDLLSKSNPLRLNPGSVVRVHRIMDGEDKRPVVYVGTVIAIRRRGMGSSVSIINKIDGELLQFNFALFSPLVTRLEILRRAHGKRQKLYGLADTAKCPVIPETATFKDLNQRPSNKSKAAAAGKTPEKKAAPPPVRTPKPTSGAGKQA